MWLVSTMLISQILSTVLPGCQLAVDENLRLCKHWILYTFVKNIKNKKKIYVQLPPWCSHANFENLVIYVQILRKYYMHINLSTHANSQTMFEIRAICRSWDLCLRKIEFFVSFRKISKINFFKFDLHHMLFARKVLKFMSFVDP